MNVLYDSLSREQARKLEDFEKMLLEKNRVMNLTAITEPEEIRVKHFEDSLAFVRCGLAPGSLIDIGSGAGFPGIPLAIAFPEMRVTLLDALQKRVHFLTEVAEALDLANVQAIHGRAEELGHMPEHREQYECCTARAVDALPVIAEYALPLLKVGGTLVAYKAADGAEEAERAENALKELGGELQEVVSYELELDGEALSRTLICIRKKAETPVKYPRRAGKPHKSPLK